MAIYKSRWGGYHSGGPEPGDVRLVRLADIEDVLSQIELEREVYAHGTGNPYGHTEIHAWHVWEVLNALKNLTPDGKDKDQWLVLHLRALHSKGE